MPISNNAYLKKTPISENTFLLKCLPVVIEHSFYTQKYMKIKFYFNIKYSTKKLRYQLSISVKVKTFE